MALSKDPTEFDGPPPQREKKLVEGSAVIGGIVGGIIFFLLFSIPTQFAQMRNEPILIGVAVVMGVILGATLTPLVTLRLWRTNSRRRSRRPGELSGNNRGSL